MWRQEGPPASEGHPLTPASHTHRHTYTSSGGRVLGVIIQGATRKTVVSVKIGDSEKSYSRRWQMGKSTDLGVQRPG